MNIMKNPSIQDYLSTLDGKSPVYDMLVMFNCKCIVECVQSNDAHSENAAPVSSNLAELAANQGPKHITSIVMYVTKTSYFNCDTMKFLVGKMLECVDIGVVESYYQTLERNFNMHPPCARYMKTEYEQLMLSPYRKCFKEMTLWDFLVDSFKLITSGSFLYGENKVYDLAFKRCLDFCVTVLQIDFEASKIDSSRPLIMKCLNYNPDRKTRMSEITKLLEMLFNTGYDLQMSIFNLAYLIDQMMK